MGCFVVAGFVLTSASRGLSAIALRLVTVLLILKDFSRSQAVTYMSCTAEVVISQKQ